MTSLRFSVVGADPIPQGSARAFVRDGRAVVTSDNPRLKAWRRVVAGAALEARERAGWGTFVGPVEVAVSFFLQRPRTVARDRPIGAREGDVDKLVRAVLDAMTTAGVYEDDSRVVRVTAEKVYASGAPGVAVVVEPVSARDVPGDGLPVLEEGEER